MSVNYGWFAQLSEIENLETEIDSFLLAGEGSSIEFTSKRYLYDDSRVAGNGPTSYISVSYDGSNVKVVRGGDVEAVFYNLGLDYGKPNSIKIESITDNGTPSYRIYVDGVLKETQASASGSNGFWTVKAVLSNASAGKSGSISQLRIKSTPNTDLINLDGNYVLNADGTDFILRTEADKNPEGEAGNPNSGETGYKNKLYDVTATDGGHIALASTDGFEFNSSTVLPEEVRTGSVNSFTTPSGFNVTDVIFDTYSVPFTHDMSTNSGTFTAPSLGTTTDFSPFGEVEVTLIDSVNGVESKGTTMWLPESPYEYLTLKGDPDTGVMSNGYYNWPDPPVETNQIVYDPTNYSISQYDGGTDSLGAYYGRLVIRPDAPKDFSVNEYIIDDEGIKGFIRTSEASQDGTVVTPPSNDNTNVIIVDAKENGWTKENGVYIPPVQAAGPKSVFDADAPDAPEFLSGSKGYLRMVNGDNHPLVDVPGGQRGKMWQYRYGPRPSYFQDNGAHEINMILNVPLKHFWEVFTMYQAPNYRVDAGVAVTAENSTDWDNSVVGDIFEKTSSGAQAELAEIGENGDYSENKAAFINYDHHYSSWDTEVRNVRTGEIINLTSSRLIGTNNKFSIWWVDNDYTGSAHSGYSNQNFSIESISYPEFSGSTRTKLARGSFDGEKNGIVPSNDLEPDTIDIPFIHRIEENDSLVHFCIERKIESSLGARDSILRLWKKTTHPNGEYPDWTLISNSEGFSSFSPAGHENIFTHGYNFGWANSGFREETLMGMKKHEIWTEKPAFLP